MKQLLTIFLFLISFMASAQTYELICYSCDNDKKVECAGCDIKGNFFTGIVLSSRSAPSIALYSPIKIRTVSSQIYFEDAFGTQKQVAMSKISNYTTFPQLFDSLAICFCSATSFIESQFLTTNGFPGNVAISEGNSITISVDDADADPLNEIQDLQLIANILAITNKTIPTLIDLSPYLDNTDDQNLIWTSATKTLGIEDGNSVILNHDHAASDISSGTMHDNRIAQSNITQHEGAINILSSQVTDLSHTIDTATYLFQDSILIYYTQGVEFSRDTIRGSGTGGSNNYALTVDFNDLTGLLTITRLGLGDITTNLDGRYVIVEGDADPLNELQNITIVDDTLYNSITLDTIDLKPYADHYTNADFDIQLATKSTTNLAEGTNLYYTEPRVSANSDVVNSINHITNDLDLSAINEFQDLSYNPTTKEIAITNGINAIISGFALLSDSTMWKIVGDSIMPKDSTKGIAIDSLSRIDKLKIIDIYFDTSFIHTDHKTGTMSWDAVNETVTVDMSQTDVHLQLGQEMYVRIVNETGSLIPNGTVVYIDGSSGGRSSIKLAKADLPTTSGRVIGVTTHEIAIAGTGLCTTFGSVGDLNTSTYTASDPLYLSATTFGGFTNVKPEYPNYEIQIGSVLTSDITTGKILVNVIGKPRDIQANAWNGDFLEPFDFRTSSNGVTVTGNLKRSDVSDYLTMNFSDGYTLLDVSGAGLDIVLTPGTSSLPQSNFVYIPVSTKVLTHSISSFPAEEHIKIACIILLDAVTTQVVGGALGNQNSNDPIAGANQQGHILHITERLRQFPAHHSSGTAGVFTINSTPSPDSATFAVPAGKIWQMHLQDWTAKDMLTIGDTLFVVNDFTQAYKMIGNVYDALTDANNVTMSGKSFSYVFWGIANKSGEKSFMMMNLPTGSYNSAQDAIDDLQSYSSYGIPDNLLPRSFLIGRATVTHAVGGGGTFTLDEYQDLRKKLPNTTASSSAGGGGGVTEFAQLIDVPNSYLTHGNKIVHVNAAETGLEYRDEKTDAEIKIAYENNLNTNEFDDAEQLLLSNQSNSNSGDEIQATTTVSGISEHATVVEIDGGTDVLRVITPAGLSGSQLQTDTDLNSAKVSNIDQTSSFVNPNLILSGGGNSTDISSVNYLQKSTTHLYHTGGNFGIGAVPTYPLDILTSNTTPLRIQNSGAGNIYIPLINSAHTWTMMSEGGEFKIAKSGQPVSLRLLTGGLMGIGNITPTQHLHIDGNIRVDGHYYDINNSKGTFDQVLRAGTLGAEWKDETAAIWNLSGTNIYNPTGYKLGIGTALPFRDVEVRGNLAGDFNPLRLRNEGAGDVWIELQKSTDNWQYGIRGSKFTFWHGVNGNQMEIGTNSSIGFGGTAVADYDFYGDIRIRGALLDINGAGGTNGQMPTSDGAGGWSYTTPPGAGGGEINTASNSGVGLSLFYLKAGVDLGFNGIKSENDRLTIALDGTTHDIEATINEGNIIHDNLSGFVANEHIDHSTIDIFAGNGLTGDGTIDGDVTLHVIPGIGLKTTANDISIETLDAIEWQASQTFKMLALTDAATIAWNHQTDQVTHVTLAGNRTLGNPTLSKSGGAYTIIFVQDATGNRTISFSSDYYFPGGVAPTLSTAANAVDMMTCINRLTKQHCNMLKDYK